MKVAFDLASLGELQFIKPVMKLLESKHPQIKLIVVHHSTTRTQFESLYGSQNAIKHYRFGSFKLKHLDKPDLFVTSEQYSGGLLSIYSICMFHGQPSKGLTFTKEILFNFDAFFYMDHYIMMH